MTDALAQRLPAGAHRRPARREHAHGPAGEPARRGGHDATASNASASRAGKCCTAAADLGGCFVEPALVRAQPGHADPAGGDLRADSLPGRIRRAGRGHRLAQRCAAGAFVGHVHHQPDLRGDFLSHAAAIAASPTSTSAPAARRSAARSAARRIPAAAANPAATPGRPTCAARPTPSTGRQQLPLAQGIKFQRYNMIYTCYEMIRDCRAGQSRGLGVLSDKLYPRNPPVFAPLFSRSGWRPARCLNVYCARCGSPNPASSSRIDPAPERAFVAGLRQQVLAAVEADRATATPELTLDIETLGAALEPLTLTEKLVVWFETMRYGDPDTGRMLRMSPGNRGENPGARRRVGPRQHGHLAQQPAGRQRPAVGPSRICSLDQGLPGRQEHFSM